MCVKCGHAWHGKKTSSTAPRSGGGRNLDIVLRRRQILAKSKKTQKLLEFIGRVDEAFKPDRLTARARSLFLAVQDHWQQRVYWPIKEELAAAIYKDHAKQLEGLRRNHEINIIDDLSVDTVDLVNVRYTNKAADREFTALITATGTNYYVDARTNKRIRGDRTPGQHQEFWTFEYDQQSGRFLLREIEQSSASDILADDNFFEPFTKDGVRHIYQEEADQQGEAGPWLEKKAEIKENKTEKLLNFLVQTDKIWNRREMLEGARSLFLQFTLDREKGILSEEVRGHLFPEPREHLKQQFDEMRGQNIREEYRNLSVRKVELVLIRNFHDNKKDEYIVRIRAHAQRRFFKGNTITHQDADVTTWEEYWVFGNHNRQGIWKLKEMLPDAQGKGLWDQENVDEDTSEQMLNWYYSKDRAV